MTKSSASFESLSLAPLEQLSAPDRQRMQHTAPRSAPLLMNSQDFGGVTAPPGYTSAPYMQRIQHTTPLAPGSREIEILQKDILRGTRDKPLSPNEMVNISQHVKAVVKDETLPSDELEQTSQGVIHMAVDQAIKSGATPRETESFLENMKKSLKYWFSGNRLKLAAAAALLVAMAAHPAARGISSHAVGTVGNGVKNFAIETGLMMKHGASSALAGLGLTQGMERLNRMNANTKEPDPSDTKKPDPSDTETPDPSGPLAKAFDSLPKTNREWELAEMQRDKTHYLEKVAELQKNKAQAQAKLGGFAEVLSSLPELNERGWEMAATQRELNAASNEYNALETSLPKQKNNEKFKKMADRMSKLKGTIAQLEETKAQQRMAAALAQNNDQQPYVRDQSGESHQKKK